MSTHTKGLDLCPRCGSPCYFKIRKRGGRAYVYAVHYVGGRKVEHYVGPAGHYEYVERLLKLNLAGLLEVDPLEVAIAAISALAHSKERTTEKVGKLERIKKAVEGYIEELRSGGVDGE